MRSMRSIARGRAAREPEAAVAREALLRREVVDVERRRRSTRMPPAADVPSTTTSASPGRSVQRHHDAGRRLVVRVRVDVALDRVEAWPAPRRVRTRAPRGRRGAARPCATAANFDENSPSTRCELRCSIEAERGRVPEQRRAAVAEQHLVAVGQREQVGEPFADAAARRIARRRAGGWCRGSRGAACGERGDRVVAHLRRAGTEAAVAGRRSGGRTMLCRYPCRRSLTAAR